MIGKALTHQEQRTQTQRSSVVSRYHDSEFAPLSSPGPYLRRYHMNTDLFKYIAVIPLLREPSISSAFL